MTDGAFLGVSAKRALGTILGGEPSPSEDEQMDAGTFRQWLLDAPENPDDYGDAARLAGKYLLAYMTAHPEHAQLPMSAEYDWERMRADGEMDRPDGLDFERYLIRQGVWDYASKADPRLGDLGLSGFQAGWAFNAARRCLEMPEAPNPALLTIGSNA